MGQLFGGGAHGLDDDGNGALLGIVVINGDGDALTVLIHTQDDELARLGLLGDQGRLDLVQRDCGTEGLFSDDAIHTIPSFPNDEIKRPVSCHIRITYIIIYEPEFVNPLTTIFSQIIH